MANRKRIASYGRRGQLVRVFSEDVTTRGTKQRLVRVQWNEFRGAPLETASWPYGKENVATAKGYAEGVAQRLAAGLAPAPVDRTIRELANAHVQAEGEAWAPATLRNFRHRWSRFEAFALKHTPARLITEETLDEFRDAMRRAGVVTNQRGETIGVVKQVFRWARRRKLIGENPIAEYTIKLAKGERRVDVPEWAPDDVRRMFEQLARDGASRSVRLWRLEVALYLAALQGPRQNALRHIAVDDVNLSGKTVRHPTAAGVVLPPRSVWFNPAWDKTDQERVQPLTRGAVRVIRIARVWRARIGYAGPWLLPPVHNKAQPWTYQALNQALRTLCARCTPPVAWVKGRALHGFRKYAAGEIHRITGSERGAADWIGDKSVQIVRKHYLKKRAEEQRSVAGQMTGPAVTRRASSSADRQAAADRQDAARKPVTHGTRTGYNRGCRCDGCRTAQREHIRQQRGTDPTKYRIAEANRNAVATQATNTNAPRSGEASEVLTTTGDTTP